MKNFLRKAITGLFTTGIAVALFPALTAHAATNMGTKTVDLSNGKAVFDFAENDYYKMSWLNSPDVLTKYMSLTDGGSDKFYYDFDNNGTDDMSVTYYFVYDDQSRPIGGNITFEAVSSVSLDSISFDIPDSEKADYDNYNEDYYGKINLILKGSGSSTVDNNTANNNTLDNNTTNNNNNTVDNNTNNNNNNTPAASNNNTPKQAPLYDDLADALNNAINAGGKVTVDYKTTGDALPNYIMKKLYDNPNVTLNYTFEYEGNTYNVSLNKKNINYKESIEWFGPLYILKYAKAK